MEQHQEIPELDLLRILIWRRDNHHDCLCFLDIPIIASDDGQGLAFNVLIIADICRILTLNIADIIAVIMADFLVLVLLVFLFLSLILLHWFLQVCCFFLDLCLEILFLELPCDGEILLELLDLDIELLSALRIRNKYRVPFMQCDAMPFLAIAFYRDLEPVAYIEAALSLFAFEKYGHQVRRIQLQV
jgi:hypothetical protein